MRHVIVVLKVVVYDGVVDVVGSDEMFESPGPFFWSSFDIVDLYGGDVDGLSRICARCEISLYTIDQRYPSYHWSGHYCSLG